MIPDVFDHAFGERAQENSCDRKQRRPKDDLQNDRHHCERTHGLPFDCSNRVAL